ncbi:hypothetical protein C0991_003349, partial [Blastosporella zonata]
MVDPAAPQRRHQEDLVPDVSGLHIHNTLDHAREEHFRGNPNPVKPAKALSKDKQAYVVFHGHKNGIFYT